MTTIFNSVRFSATLAEVVIIEQIADRALRMKIYPPRMWSIARNDVEAVHSNGCPLRLADLLDADPLPFIHDMCGIRENLDPYTGKLSQFWPRSARVGWAMKAAPVVAPWATKPAPAIAWAVPKAAPSDGWSTNPPHGWRIESFKPTPGGWGSSF
jgi:hypothetical protein